MKQIIILFIVLLTSCSTKESTKIKPIKTVFIPHSELGTENSFDVYLGSDKHEYYILYMDGPNQWFHYGGCSKCFKCKN